MKKNSFKDALKSDKRIKQTASGKFWLKEGRIGKKVSKDESLQTQLMVPHDENKTMVDKRRRNL